MMRASVILPLALAACMDTAPGEIPESRDIAAGRQLLVFFEIGHDEPPESGILRACDTSQTGLCVDQNQGVLNPLNRVGDALVYANDFYRVTMRPDGSGIYQVPESGYQIDVTWMTTDWE